MDLEGDISGTGDGEFDAVVIEAGGGVGAGFGIGAAEFFDFGEGGENLEEVRGGGVPAGKFDGAGVEEEGEGIPHRGERVVFGAGQEVVAVVDGLVRALTRHGGVVSDFVAGEGGVGNFEAKALGRGSGGTAEGFGNGALAQPFAQLDLLFRGKLLEEGLAALAAGQDCGGERVPGGQEGVVGIGRVVGGSGEF